MRLPKCGERQSPQHCAAGCSAFGVESRGPPSSCLSCPCLLKLEGGVVARALLALVLENLLLLLRGGCLDVLASIRVVVAKKGRGSMSAMAGSSGKLSDVAVCGSFAYSAAALHRLHRAGELGITIEEGGTPILPALSSSHFPIHDAPCHMRGSEGCADARVREERPRGARATCVNHAPSLCSDHLVPKPRYPLTCGMTSARMCAHGWGNAPAPAPPPPPPWWMLGDQAQGPAMPSPLGLARGPDMLMARLTDIATA